jgi:hypothetical protein
MMTTATLQSDVYVFIFGQQEFVVGKKFNPCEAHNGAVASKHFPVRARRERRVRRALAKTPASFS